MLLDVEFGIVVDVEVTEELESLVVGADDGEHALERAKLVHRRVVAVARIRDLRKIKVFILVLK